MGGVEALWGVLWEADAPAAHCSGCVLLLVQGLKARLEKIGALNAYTEV